MKYLKIAAPKQIQDLISSEWTFTDITGELNPAELAAAVVNKNNFSECKRIEQVKQESQLEFPVLKIDGSENASDLKQKIELAAKSYEEKAVPKFLHDLVNFANSNPLSFTTPGHHNGLFYAKHPAGQVFNKFFGQNMLNADTSDTVPELGDMMTHAGSPLDAEEETARAFNANKAYFVTNGTTTSNSVCASAVLNPGDFVLFDRNNHKSLYNSALMLQGAKPIYINTSRNPLGLIGAIQSDELSEEKLRARLAKFDPQKAKAKRPFRMAIIQAETYDGVLTSAPWIIKKLGRLCDYILFDCAWSGYEQFTPLLENLSPLSASYGPEDPGILVTQSVHKQQAGMTQVSQILKKDSHIKGQRRYVDHIHFNNAYLKFVTSSYSYPLYASLVANAALASSSARGKWWHDLLIQTIDFRKKLLKQSKIFKPFVPELVDGRKWEDVPDEELASNLDAWRIKPEDGWHGFTGNDKQEAVIDPFKITLELPGVDVSHAKYAGRGIPGAVVQSYLLEKHIVPGKADFNSLLLLPTAGDGQAEFDALFDALTSFEKLYTDNASLQQVLPKLYSQNSSRYHGYRIQQLCDEMQAYYSSQKTFTLQKELFTRQNWDDYDLTPRQADQKFMHNEGYACPLEEIKGKIALEGALPYPPGVFVVAPGERWTKASQDYFLTLAGAMERFPGFTPEIQGVHYKIDDQGKVKAFGMVLS